MTSVNDYCKDKPCEAVNWAVKQEKQDKNLLNQFTISGIAGGNANEGGGPTQGQRKLSSAMLVWMQTKNAKYYSRNSDNGACLLLPANTVSADATPSAVFYFIIFHHQCSCSRHAKKNSNDKGGSSYGIQEVAVTFIILNMRLMPCAR